MRWLKRIIGIVLILAAVAAMYFWNKGGREKATSVQEDVETVIEEAVIDERIEILAQNLSYFAFSKEKFYLVSGYIKANDIVRIYNMDSFIDPMELSEITTADAIGKYKIAYVDEDRVEIICKIEDFAKFNQAERLLMVLEGIDE